MRAALAVVTILLALIQWPLWFGKGGWLRVVDLQGQLDEQRAANAVASARNGGLAAELASLTDGREAIEERARHELHLVRSDEVFFQFVGPAGVVAVPHPGSPGAGDEPR